MGTMFFIPTLTGVTDLKEAKQRHADVNVRKVIHIGAQSE